MDTGQKLLLFGAAALVFLSGKARAPGSLIAAWADARGIPLDVLNAWITNESNFDPNAYNPEKSAMLSWSTEIVANPQRWGANPDFSKAQYVHDQLVAGATTSALASSWTFGSYGLLQVSRIGASERGGYPYSAPNSALFDPDLNLNVGTQYIASLKQAMYGGGSLSDDQWAHVRAAYVGGRGIFDKAPDTADAIAQKFLTTLSRVRTSPPVA